MFDFIKFYELGEAHFDDDSTALLSLTGDKKPDETLFNPTGPTKLLHPPNKALFIRKSPN